MADNPETEPLAPRTQPDGLTIGISTASWRHLSGARDLFRSLVTALLQQPGNNRFVILGPRPPLDDLHRITHRLTATVGNRVRIPGAAVRAAQRLERMLRLRSFEPGAEVLARRRRAAFEWLGEGVLDRVDFADVDDSPPALNRALKELGIDLVVPALAVLEVPFVGYLFDCQHRHLPHFFSADAIRERDKHFTRMVRHSKALIVNSENAKDDLVEFFDADPQRILVLPFAPPLETEWLATRPELLAGYRLPERYFLVSNQFWVHKSLQTVIEAVHLLQGRGATDIQVVFTGQMSDHRFPDYPEQIVDLSRRLGLEQNIAFLGFIPKRDQIEILKHAVAVVQPTLFEGAPGGGSVFYAVGLGVPVIASDIEVNKELPAQADVTFFRAGDHRALAERMAACWARPATTRPDGQTLLQRNAKRRAGLSAALYRAIDQAMAPDPLLTLSVIVVANRDEQALQQTLASLTTQSHPALEVIVIGHRNATTAPAQPPPKLVPRYLIRAAGSDYAAMNQGAAAATGDLLYFLSAGDQVGGRANSDRVFEAVAQQFARPYNASLQLLYGNIETIDRNGIVIESLHSGPYPFHRYLDDSPPQQACFYRAAAFADRPPLDTSFGSAGFHELNARLVVARRCRSKYLDMILARRLAPPEYAEADPDQRKRVEKRYFGAHFRVQKRYIDSRLEEPID